MPDAKFGEQVCAWIRLREGSEAGVAEIQDYCCRHLADCEVPYYVRFVDTFPMTVTGKVQKYLMREAMGAELASRRRVREHHVATLEIPSRDTASMAASPTTPVPPGPLAPLRSHKGRGAASNPEGRFESVRHQAEDDGWQSALLDGDAPRPPTCVTDERARSVISRNDSPDIAFSQAINPYRGCEHGMTYW